MMTMMMMMMMTMMMVVVGMRQRERNTMQKFEKSLHTATITLSCVLDDEDDKTKLANLALMF